MPSDTGDIWSRWLLHRRFGDDDAFRQENMERLAAVRDRVLENASLADGEVLLDVGCGDGLIAFGALEKVPNARVIFSDISQDLLHVARDLAAERGVEGRSRFLLAPADDLSALQDASVDVVAMRSVLIYVSDKAGAFREFHRVLRPGGRLSIFEPINRFPGHGSGFEHLFGYDVSPVAEIARKVRHVFYALQPRDTDPMLNFDERDLVASAEAAGFNEVRLDLRVEVRPPTLGSWDAFIGTAGNPKIPTLEEAMAQSLTPEEAAALTAHLRPLVEARDGTHRSAVAFLRAVK
jgi:arsenite methyltransferase